MKLQELVITEIKSLYPEELLKAYSYVRTIHSMPPRMMQPQLQKEPPYMRARKALGGITYSLSEEIVADREDRL